MNIPGVLLMDFFGPALFMERPRRLPKNLAQNSTKNLLSTKFDSMEIKLKPYVLERRGFLEISLLIVPMRGLQDSPLFWEVNPFLSLPSSDTYGLLVDQVL